MNTNPITTPSPEAPVVYIRIPAVLKIIPVSRSTWWQWVRDGKAPQAHKLGQKITVWRLDEITEFSKKLSEQG